MYAEQGCFAKGVWKALEKENAESLQKLKDLKYENENL